jgi:hypothetical protein
MGADTQRLNAEMRAPSLACVRGYRAFHVASQWRFLATLADMLVKAAAGGLAQEKSPLTLYGLPMGQARRGFLFFPVNPLAAAAL